MSDRAFPEPDERPMQQWSNEELQAAWFWCLVDQDPDARQQQILDELLRRQIGPGTPSSYGGGEIPGV